MGILKLLYAGIHFRTCSGLPFAYDITFWGQAPLKAPH